MARSTVGRAWIIYKITCTVSGKSYIGLTCDTLRQRWSNHVCARHSKRKISHLAAAIIKYGRDAFSMTELLRLNSLAEASEAERRLICEHRTLNPNGYNISHGGMGTPGVRRPHHPLTKLKISIANLGRVHSPESRAKMSAAKLGKQLAQEHRAKLGIHMRGKPKSAAQIAKQSAAVRGRKFPKRSIALLKASISGGAASTTGHRGVIQEGNGWTARIGINGKRVAIGTFASKKAASDAYKQAVELRINELEAEIDGVDREPTIKVLTAGRKELFYSEEYTTRRSNAAIKRWQQWRENRQKQS